MTRTRAQTWINASAAFLAASGSNQDVARALAVPNSIGCAHEASLPSSLDNPHPLPFFSVILQPRFSSLPILPGPVDNRVWSMQVGTHHAVSKEGSCVCQAWKDSLLEGVADVWTSIRPRWHDGDLWRRWKSSRSYLFRIHLLCHATFHCLHCGVNSFGLMYPYLSQVSLRLMKRQYCCLSVTRSLLV